VGETETGDKRFGEGGPVHVGVGGVVGGVGAAGPGEFAREPLSGPLNAGQRLAQTGGVDGHLLAERCGGRRLAMSAGEHRHVPVLMGHISERVPNLAEFRDQHFLDGGLDEQAVGEVVHVLAGEPEVNPLGSVYVLGQALADEVLDGFHVVVRGRILAVAFGFELFDYPGVLLIEPFIEGFESGLLVLVDFKRRRAKVSKGDEILDFDAHTGTHERLFAGVLDQGLSVAGVAAIQRRHCLLRGTRGHTPHSTAPAKKPAGLPGSTPPGRGSVFHLPRSRRGLCLDTAYRPRVDVTSRLW